MKKGRKYFFYSVCHLCRNKFEKKPISCIGCKMIFYCSADHMENDGDHQDFCNALKEIIRKRGGELYGKKFTQQLTSQDFQTYRFLTMTECKKLLMRELQPFEQEIILFPRICKAVNCRETAAELLDSCPHCGEVFFCKKNVNHLDKFHKIWCYPYLLLKLVNLHQEKNGICDPNLPQKILNIEELPTYMTMTNIFKILEIDSFSSSEYALLTLAATAPLTAWYGSRLTDCFRLSEMIIHLIGAENDFEVASLPKWEAFFLHLLPNLKLLKIVFIGPELQIDNFPKKLRLCKNCHNNCRIIKFSFENLLYHEYCQKSTFQEPNLICFYNSGLHRTTGYKTTDTWPSTIQQSTRYKCPIIVTSYTHHESPLDLRKFLNYSTRKLNLILPPIVNPFFSKKADRNFISDEKIPLIFKNFYCFIIQ